MDEQTCPLERMERLLVATDGSEASRGAVAVGMELAKNCSVKSTKLLAVAVVLTNLEYESALPWVIADAEKEMQQKLKTVKGMAETSGIDCEIVVQRGEDPSAEILDQAVRNKVDMIVMGTHGRTGVKRFVMGSVVANVIGHAPCRVLVVPPDARVGFGTVLVATDGSRHGDAAISEAIAIARSCNSSLIIVSAAPLEEDVATAEQIVKRALEAADQEGVRKEGIVLRGKAGQAIVEAAGRQEAGLIVMGSHGKTGLMSLVMGSVTEYVLSHGNTAVLVAKLR
jgi:nucleotide-binding universal stress UspA family protein